MVTIDSAAVLEKSLAFLFFRSWDIRPAVIVIYAAVVYWLFRRKLR